MSSGCSDTTRMSFAQLWLRIMRAVRGVSKDDMKRRAKLTAENTIAGMLEQEKSYTTNLRVIAGRVKAVPTGKKNSQEMRELLLRSRNMRSQLTMLHKKRFALEAHLETLNVSELNTQILASVQETSSVLKSMGLDKNIESMDEVMMDMKESIADVSALQDGLAQSVDVNGDVSEDGLDEELRLLLSDDECQMQSESWRPAVVEPTPTTAPASISSMQETDGNSVRKPAVLVEA